MKPKLEIVLLEVNSSDAEKVTQEVRLLLEHMDFQEPRQACTDPVRVSLFDRKNPDVLNVEIPDDYFSGRTYESSDPQQRLRVTPANPDRRPPVDRVEILDAQNTYTFFVKPWSSWGT